MTTDPYELVDAYSQHVVGESFYRSTLNELMATVDPDDDGWRHLEVTLTLVADPANPHDRYAIKVMCRGRQVGHIPRDETHWFHANVRRRRLRRGVTVPGLILGTGEKPYGVRYRL